MHLYMNIKFAISALLLASTLTATAQRKAKVSTSKREDPATQVKAKQNKLFDEMLDNTQQLFVVDSIVVAKEEALKTIALDASLGQIVPYDTFFNGGGNNDAFVYVNGFGNKCYYAVNDSTGNSRLFCREKLGDNWGEPQQIKGLGSDLKFINYPFMTSDGETFYFAAKSDGGLGGFDIYMTRYDPEEGKFLEAENVGLPYNSHGDDYLFVEDDIHNFAWFATSRRQPEGKVCVYTVKTGKKRKNYNADDYDEKKLRQLAQLWRIRDTWPTPQQQDAAMKQLEGLRKQGAAKTGLQETNFVVNDELTYNGADSFKSDVSRQLFAKLTSEENKLRKLDSVLETQRIQYHSAEGTAKAQLAEAITGNEKTKQRTLENIKSLSTQIRQLENNK